ncbi:MAG: hypothetical protein ABJI60_02270 [Kangiellaceae bacterium]
MSADRRTDFNITRLLFLILVFVSVLILAKLDSKYFELFFTAALVSYLIFILSVYTGSLRWYGTVFLFVFFASFQFVAILVPTFFDIMPHHRFFENDSVAEHYFIYYMFIFLSGYALLLVAYGFGKKIKVPNYSLKCTSIPMVLCYLPFSIAIFSFYKIFSAGGGIVNTVLNMGSVNSLLADIGIYGSLSKVGFTTCCMLMLVRSYRSCMFVFVVLTILNAAMGERGAILFSGLIPLLVTYRLSHGKIAGKYIGMGLFFFLLFYLILGAYRGANISESKSQDLTAETVINVLNKTEHHISAAATIQLADKGSYYYGKTLMNVLYVPVPRSIWNEKPVVAESVIIGMELKGTSSTVGSGLPPGVFAYGYIQFGLLGVIFTALLSGLIAGVAEKYFLTVLTMPNILLYSQCQALFIHFLSTEVQVKFLVSFLTISIVILLSMAWQLFKNGLRN